MTKSIIKEIAELKETMQDSFKISKKTSSSLTKVQEAIDTGAAIGKQYEEIRNTLESIVKENKQMKETSKF